MDRVGGAKVDKAKAKAANATNPVNVVGTVIDGIGKVFPASGGAKTPAAVTKADVASAPAGLPSAVEVIDAVGKAASVFPRDAERTLQTLLKPAKR